MKNKKQKNTMLLLLILLGVSVGFALLSTTLKINGTAGIKSSTWDIHWENVQPNLESTITTETPTISNDGTTVTYDVELSLPGDFYEFTVDAKNDGSINGKIDDIRHTIQEVTIENEEEVLTPTTLPNYILYSVYYDGTTTVPAQGDILEAGDSQKYRVRIEFDRNSTTIPETDKVYRITDEIDYVQTKDKAPVDIDELMDEIEADPDSHRNPDQSVSNRDIGIDENGNIINLDMWVVNENQYPEEEKQSYEEYFGLKLYNKDDVEDEIVLGLRGAMYAPATGAAQIVNGEVTTPIPAYILLDGESEFYPVTEIHSLFGNFKEREVPENGKITKFPKLPSTIITIGDGAFWKGYLEGTVELPTSVRNVEINAFYFNDITKIVIPNNINICGGDPSKHGNLLSPFEYNPINSIETNIPTISTGQFNNDNGIVGSLTSVTFNKDVQSIGSNVFGSWGSYSSNFITSVTNKTGKAFNWCEILNLEYYEGECVFETGTINYYFPAADEIFEINITK